MTQQAASGLDDAALERLHADVMAVPPDQQALGLAEAIQEQAHYDFGMTRDSLRFRLGVIQGNAERLIALLERQAEAPRDVP